MQPKEETSAASERERNLRFLAAAQQFEGIINETHERLQRGEVDNVRTFKVRGQTAYQPPDREVQTRAQKDAAIAAEPEHPAAAPAAAAPPAREAFTTSAPLQSVALTDEQIFDKCAIFYDKQGLGPIFVSDSINRKIYVAKYPRFGDVLSAQRLTGQAPADSAEETVLLFGAVGELQECIYGWLYEHEPGVDIIKAYPNEPAKWPKLRKFEPLLERDPRFQVELLLLWKQYVGWKARVTPTDDEVEKYSGVRS